MENKKTSISPEFFFIDRNSKHSLQVQLIVSIVTMILQKNIAAGTRLPSTRSLAKHLKISRLTISLAYQELVSQSYLTALPRSGYAVSEKAPRRRFNPGLNASEQVSIDWNTRLNRKLVKRRHIVKPSDWRSYPFPFIYGQMDSRLFNYSAWRECARLALGAKDFSEMANDWVDIDDQMLVDHICSRTLPRRGIDARPEEILITMGAQNALWIAIDLLSYDNKRKAVFEDPGYPDVAEILRQTQMPMVALPIDDKGFNPDSLPKDTGLVCVTPSHHVPTGITMPMDRRQQLLQKADELDFIIIEDDYEFERSYLTPPSPTLKSLDKSGRIIYLGSFSKSIFPGLRLGYMVAPEPFIREARGLRAMLLRHPPGILQRTTAYFLAQGYYDALIVKTRQRFKKRHDLLVSCLSDHNIEIAGPLSHGGSSLWIKGPDGLNSEKLSQVLQNQGVLIEPGHPFFETPEERCRYFRMAYSSITVKNIPEGVARLATQMSSH